jgi:hypothetical protein
VLAISLGFLDSDIAEFAALVYRVSCCRRPGASQPGSATIIGDSTERMTSPPRGAAAAADPHVGFLFFLSHDTRLRDIADIVL